MLEDNFIFHASLEYNVSGKSQFSISKDLAIRFILMKMVSGLFIKEALLVKNHVKSFTIAKRPLNIHLIFIEIFYKIFSNADRGSLMSFFSA